MTKTIQFKSVPACWIKEYQGLKRNTARVFKESGDIREEVLKEFIKGNSNMLNVEIRHTETGETFTRQVTNVAVFEDFYIISW